jgi:trk system potassium uptake protein TrkA
MKIIILGAGQVGSSIATYLAAQNNDVTIIDTSAERLRKLNDALDVQTVVGHASYPETLRQVGTDAADMLIAVTQSDEVNMVACRVAQSLFGVPMKIARIRHKGYLDPLWSDLYGPDHFPIDVIISPEDEVAMAIARSLRVYGAFDVVSMGSGLVKVIGVRCGNHAPLINTPIRYLNTLAPDVSLMVAAIVRENQSFFPRESDVLLPGDEVYFLAKADQIVQAMALFRQDKVLSRHLVIMGGGKIGRRLAQELEKAKDINIKMIEQDPTRAAYVAASLQRTIVLCGDALDTEILREASVHTSEAVVSVTDNDKANILAGLLAKRQGAPRAMTLLNDMSYAPLVMSLGIDAVISPRSITVSRILQHIRRGRIRGIYSLREGFGEIIEAEVLETSSAISMTVGEINNLGDVLVLAIIRASEVIIARSQIDIIAHDRIILIARSEAVDKIEQLFAVRLDYF